jgi:hypothetical protein
MTVTAPARAVRALPYVALAVLLASSAPPWPDDWDGVGFLEAVTRFDLDAFVPHPPGYPVYVALLRVANAVARDPRAAAYAVAVASALFAAWLAGDAARRRWGERARWTTAAALVATPLAWRSMSAIGSEAPALALVALGAWAIARGRDRAPGAGLALGVAVGLGLGVRLSWAPLYLPMLLFAPRGSRVGGACAAAASAGAWAAALLAIVGPAHLLQLMSVHAAGHARVWGGTALTQPGLAARGALLARDVLVDGLGGGADALGVAIDAAAAALALLGIAAWRRARWRGLLPVAIVLLPYAAWIALGQNLRQQPRHALPLVAAAAVGLARAALTGARARALGIALAALVCARTALDAVARRTTPPPVAQLVEWTRALPDARGVAVFAGPSARFFELTELADRATTAGSLGDARVSLTRMNELPARVLVTSELEAAASSREPLVRVATFCRPARLDRRAPCLDVYDWRLPFLRPPVTP